MGTATVPQVHHVLTGRNWGVAMFPGLRTGEVAMFPGLRTGEVAMFPVLRTGGVAMFLGLGTGGVAKFPATFPARDWFRRVSWSEV